jgi:hypothetical protein
MESLEQFYIPFCSYKNKPIYEQCKLENVTHYTKLLMTFRCITLVPDPQYCMPCSLTLFLSQYRANQQQTNKPPTRLWYVLTTVVLQLTFRRHLRNCTLTVLMLIFTVPYCCISTSVLQGTVYISLLLHAIQDTTVCNNLRCCLIHDYLTCILPDYK